MGVDILDTLTVPSSGSECETKQMRPQNIYLLLSLVGVILPYRQLVPWVLEHGLDAPLFFEHLFANRISAFFATDVFVSTVVIFVFIGFERSRLGSRWWVPILAVLTVGVSLGLHLLLYLREGQNQSAKSAVF